MRWSFSHLLFYTELEVTSAKARKGDPYALCKPQFEQSNKMHRLSPKRRLIKKLIYFYGINYSVRRLELQVEPFIQTMLFDSPVMGHRTLYSVTCNSVHVLQGRAVRNLEINPLRNPIPNWEFSLSQLLISPL